MTRSRYFENKKIINNQNGNAPIWMRKNNNNISLDYPIGLKNLGNTCFMVCFDFAIFII